MYRSLSEPSESKKPMKWRNLVVFPPIMPPAPQPAPVSVLVSFHFDKTDDAVTRSGYGDVVLELDRFPDTSEKIEEIRRFLIDNTPGEVDFVVIISITRLDDPAAR